MIWIYRILAAGVFGIGAYLVLGDLPPHTGFLPGLEFDIGLYVFLLPGAANLVNTFYGQRFALLRWGMVVVNAVFVVFAVALVMDEGFDPGALLVGAAFLAVLVISVMFARTGSKASISS